MGTPSFLPAIVGEGAYNNLGKYLYTYTLMYDYIHIYGLSDNAKYYSEK